jgi:MFS transporter, UMF1 family
MNVVSLYFALWVTTDCGAPDIVYSSVYSISMLLVAIFSPIFGVIADRSSKVIYIMAMITLMSCLATSMIGFSQNLMLGLFFFLIANFCYQSALVFYNSILPYISNEKNIGKISGFGVGLGYVGAIVGLKLIQPFVIADSFNKISDVFKPIIKSLLIIPFSNESILRINAFIPTAIFYLIFALPCFIFVRLVKGIKRSETNISLKSAFHEILTSIKSAKKYKNIFLFLISNLLFMDAVHTVITFMSVYASKVIKFDDSEIINLLIISTSAAIFGSLIWGYLSDILGSKKTLNLILYLWVIALILACTISSKPLFLWIGAIFGIALGGVWVTTRPLVVALSPKDKTGEFFGLYGMTGKCASIVGPMIWGLITYLFDSLGEMKYRIAILMMGIQIVAGIIVLNKIRIPDVKIS